MPSRWTTLIHLLENNHPYLDSFGKTIDEIVFETLRDANIKVPPFKYPPLLIESLLGDVSELLDRCMQYRSLASELEIAVVQHALSRELDIDLNVIDTSLSEVVSLTEEFAEQARRQQAVAGKYDPSGLNPGEPMTRLLSGKMEEARASVGSAGDLQKIEQDKLLKVKERLARLKKFSDDFHKRVEHPGSAHNYTERFRRAMVFFKEDLIEAYHKALCLQVGLKIVYGKDEPLPAIAETEFFDKFMLWVRRIYRFLEEISEHETELDMVLPIRLDHKLRDNPNNPNEYKALVSPDMYKIAMKEDKEWAELAFVIPADFFMGLDKVRLRGVGLSVTYQGAELQPTYYQNKQNRIFWMELITPPMKMEDGAFYYRPKLLFRNVRFYSPEMGVDYASSSAVHNLDPASSQGWKLRVRRSIIQLLDQRCEDRKNMLYIEPLPFNICLHLTVAAVPRQTNFFTFDDMQDRARSDEALRLAEEALERAKRAEERSDEESKTVDSGANDTSAEARERATGEKDLRAKERGEQPSGTEQ